MDLRPLPTTAITRGAPSSQLARRPAHGLALALLVAAPLGADERAEALAAAGESSSYGQASEGGTTAEGLPLDSPELQLRMFGDLGFRTGDREGETHSFALGQMNAFITSRLSDTLSVLSEVAFHSVGDGHGERANELALDLERLLLQYSSSDLLRIAAGRYHTAIGYYNTAYHHGTWFQTTADRPFLFAFEHDGGILPVHSVGLSLSGRIPSGRLGLRWAAEIGNGRASRTHEGEGVQNVLDENDRKAVNLALLARPEWASGLQTGVSVYLDRLTPEEMPQISEAIVAAHAVYHGARLELLNELVLVRHAPEGAAETLKTYGFYSLGSLKLGKLRPYVRYQSVDSPHDDPVLEHVGRRRGPTVGLRVDLGEFAALKAQYDRTSLRLREEESEEAHTETFNELALQLAFTF